MCSECRDARTKGDFVPVKKRTGLNGGGGKNGDGRTKANVARSEKAVREICRNLTRGECKHEKRSQMKEKIMNSPRGKKGSAK